jgi:hypothetical protein
MEFDLIRITWNQKDGAVDFGVPASSDSITNKHKDEVLEMLKKLTKRLEEGIYPFSFTREESYDGKVQKETNSN